MTDEFVNTSFEDINLDGYEKVEHEQTGYYPSLNRTATLLSCQLLIQVGTKTIGAVQEFNFTESKFGDVVLVNIFCKRIFFDKISLVQAFTGRPNLTDERIDIDIHFPDRVVTIKDVKITSNHMQIATSESVIFESATMEGTGINTVFLGESASSFAKLSKLWEIGPTPGQVKYEKE